MIFLTAKFQLKRPDITGVDLCQLRDALSMTQDDVSDSRLESLLLRAISSVEEFCGRVYRTTPWRMVFGGNGGAVFLPLYPVSSITSVTVDGVSQDSDQWSMLPSAGGWRLALAAPMRAEMIVDVVAGYGGELSAPAVFDAVVLAVAADMFEHRESQSEVNLAENKTIKSALSSLMFYSAG